jgi:hypothetical protein
MWLKSLNLNKDGYISDEAIEGLAASLKEGGYDSLDTIGNLEMNFQSSEDLAARFPGHNEAHWACILRQSDRSVITESLTAWLQTVKEYNQAGKPLPQNSMALPSPPMPPASAIEGNDQDASNDESADNDEGADNGKGAYSDESADGDKGANNESDDTDESGDSDEDDHCSSLTSSASSSASLSPSMPAPSSTRGGRSILSSRSSRSTRSTKHGEWTEWEVPLFDYAHSHPNEQLFDVKKGPPVKCAYLDTNSAQRRVPKHLRNTESFLAWTNSFSAKEKKQFLGRQCVTAQKVAKGGICEPGSSRFADAQKKSDWDKAAYGSTYISPSCLDGMVTALGGRSRIFPSELHERRDPKGIHQVRAHPAISAPDPAFLTIQ